MRYGFEVFREGTRLFLADSGCQDELQGIIDSLCDITLQPGDVIHDWEGESCYVFIIEEPIDVIQDKLVMAELRRKAREVRPRMDTPRIEITWPTLSDEERGAK